MSVTDRPGRPEGATVGPRRSAGTGGPAAAAGVSAQLPTGRDLNVIIASLAVPLFLSALDTNIVATALPTIVGEFKGFARFSWVTTAYIVTSTVSTLILGKLSDLLGRRRLLLFAIATFLVGSVLCGSAQGMTQLILFRAVQGIGGGGILALVFSTIGDLVPPSSRAKYFGMFTSVFAVASLAGPLIGGLIVDHIGWRWVFWINIPLGIAAFAVIAKVLHLTHTPRPFVLDLVGAALVTAAIAAFMIALEQGDTAGWRSPRIIGLFVLAAVLVVALVFQERRAAEPLLPPRMFRNDIIVTAWVLGFLCGVWMYSGGLYISLYFQAVRFKAPTIAGLLTFPIMLGTSFAAQMTGRYITKSGHYERTPVLGCVVAFLGFLGVSQMSPTSPLWQLLVPMLMMGLGIGLTMPAISISSQNAADMRDIGIATSATNFFRNLGGATGLAVLGTVLTARVRDGLEQRLPGAGKLGALIREPKRIKALDEAKRSAVQLSITGGVSTVLKISAGVGLLALLVSFKVRYEPLRTTVHREPAEPVGA